MKKATIHIKGMLCSSCLKLLQMTLENEGIEVVSLKLGTVVVYVSESNKSVQTVKSILSAAGFEISTSEEELLVDRIKRAVIDLIFHMNNMNSIVQKTDYLVEILNMNYEKIARIFRKHEPITLEKYIILIKIERIKDMLESEAYTLSEIAFMMDYSSVQYLSAQFKKVTGITVSEYKEQDEISRIPLDMLL